MGRGDIKPRFKKGSKEASECGKKSKRGVSIKSAMKRLIKSGKVDVDKYAQSLFDNAMKGNAGIAKLISEYLDGKVTEKTELTGRDGEPLENKVTIEFIKSSKKK